MLENVKTQLMNSNKLPEFSTFFTKYVMSVQDRNIESEIDYLMSHNTLNALNIDRVINNYLAKWVIQ